MDLQHIHYNNLKTVHIYCFDLYSPIMEHCSQFEVQEKTNHHYKHQENLFEKLVRLQHRNLKLHNLNHN